MLTSRNEDKRLLVVGSYVPLLKKLRSQDIVVASNPYVEKKLQNEEISYKVLAEYTTKKMREKAISDAMSWTLAWPNTKLIGGKNFKELVAYRNLSLWWFVKFGIFYTLTEVIEKIKIAKKMLEIEKPGKIVIIDDGKDSFGKIIGSIGDLNDIIVSRVQVKNRFSNLKKYIVRPWFIFLKKVGLSYRYLLCFLARIYYELKSEKAQTEKKKILLTSATVYRRRIVDPKTKKYKEMDILMGGIVKELIERGKEVVVVIRRHRPFSPLINIFKEKPPYKPYEIFFVDVKVIKKTLQARARIYFSKIWKNLRRNKKFIDSLTYDNVPMWKFLENTFHTLFLNQFVGEVEGIEIWEKIIEKEKPDLIVVESEYASHGLAAIALARKKHIPTVAVQHGMINQNHVGYRHNVDEVHPNRDLTPNFYPIADKTAVFGEYLKGLLTTWGAYPPDNIVVTGSPKYDRLTDAIEAYDRTKMYKQLGVDINKKIIVWTTQSHGFSREKNEVLFHAVYGAIKELGDDVQLILKLHPGEHEISMHRRKALEIDVEPMIVEDKTVDLYELLYSCDLVITVSSTTAIEATLFDKPVVILDLLKENLFSGIEGLIKVYDEKELVPAIKRALFDKKMRVKLKRERERMVSNLVYKKDGLAAKRIADLIYCMLEERG